MENTTHELNVVDIGGGNGLGQLVEGQLVQRNPRTHVTAIVSSFDDDDPEDPSSNGEYRRRGRPGYYSDLTWVVGSMHSALFGESSWLPKKFGTRFREGIPEGPFGNLLESLVGPDFQKLLHIDPRTTKDEKMRMLFARLTDHLIQRDDFRGHSFRNILLVELEDSAKRLLLWPQEALEAMHLIYGIPELLR